MKYKGTIVGFQSDFGSIYNIPVDDKRCYVWKANVVAELSEKMIKIVFNWNGEAYELILTELKTNYYTGKIIFDREPGGSCFFWSFQRENERILKGDFNDDDAGNYDCFIELRPL